ncbi:30S ribosomal protein S2 [Candidatus Gracilibacteria bacterium]|nr:30S ribosomal protein S2 [Candidatus Gracilibacteria bacterium]
MSKRTQKTPDAIFVIDGHYENLALEESKKLKIPSYALLGSTGDIDSCTDFIPCNVNSIKAIKFILDYLKPALTKKKIMRTFDTEKSFLPKKKEDNTKEIKATKSTEVEIEE